MLDTIAILIGIFGASLIGLAVAGGTRNPRPIAIIGTALTIVSAVILLLIVLGVVKV